MKHRTVLSLLLLSQFPYALAGAFTVAKGEDSSLDAQHWDVMDEAMDKLEDLTNLSTLLGVCVVKEIPKCFETSSAAKAEAGLEDDESAENGFQDFGDTMPACAAEDCKTKYFTNEVMRWVKQALKDAGVVVYENPAAATALLIGVSVLVADVMSGGMLLRATLQAIGFGPKGPIKKSFAAAMQRRFDHVQVGSMFSKLQSAAMGGAAVEELHKIARIAVTGLISVGAAKLVSAGTKPLGQSSDFDPKEWRTWESESKFSILPKGANNWAQFWGAPTSEGCIAYGYREIRAPLWFVREGEDPLNTCVQTRAVINGIGYKTPLGCVYEGPKKGVVGMWYVPTNETQCMPRWSVFEDEGCMLYGRRRKFARLLGLKSKDDWNGMCESTSASIDYKHYDGPSYCEDKGILGIYGIFDIADKLCECSCVRV